MNTYQVIEDNAGTIYFVIMDSNGNVCYFAVMQPRDVRAAIDTLDEWMHFDGNEEDGQELYNHLTSYEYGWNVIADNDGIYTERMGCAGEEAFCGC